MRTQLRNALPRSPRPATATTGGPTFPSKGLRPQSVLLLHFFRESRVFEQRRRQALLAAAWSPEN